MSCSHGFSTYAFQHATYQFYFMDFFFSWYCCTFDASVVIDFTRFCHGFAGNLRGKMEALNFSQPTRRQNGKAGGEGGAAMQKLSPALAAKLLKRQHALSAAFWSWEKKKENINLGINLFSSVQFSQSSGQWWKIPLFLPIWISMSRSPKRMVFGVIWVCQPECSAIYAPSNSIHPNSTLIQTVETADLKQRNDPFYHEILMGETFLPLFLLTGVTPYFQLTNWPKQGRVSEPVNRDKVSWLTSQ